MTVTRLSHDCHLQRTGNGKLESHGLGVYEGSWEEDLRHGTGKLVYPNRDVYVGLWENNKVEPAYKTRFTPLK